MLRKYIIFTKVSAVCRELQNRDLNENISLGLNELWCGVNE